MKEIKFRVWSHSSKTFHFLNKWTSGHKWSWALKCGAPIMEFTGMVDQKGNDIYEGDILDLPKHKLGRHGELPNGRGIVTQDNASFYCHPTNAEAGDVGHWTNPLTFWSTTQGISLGKIIGNIFQNKNLIDRYKLETTKTFLLSKLSKN